MEWVKGWAVGICAAALICTVLRYAAPERGAGKVYKLLLSSFFLCAFFYPLGKLGGELTLPSVSEEITDPSDALSQQITAQLVRQVEQRVQEVAETALQARNISADKILVSVDTKADTSIYIKQVDVYLDRTHANAAVTVRQILVQLLETEVLVHTGKG